MEHPTANLRYRFYWVDVNVERPQREQVNLTGAGSSYLMPRDCREAVSTGSIGAAWGWGQRLGLLQPPAQVMQGGGEHRGRGGGGPGRDGARDVSVRGRVGGGGAGEGLMRLGRGGLKTSHAAGAVARQCAPGRRMRRWVSGV